MKPHFEKMLNVHELQKNLCYQKLVNPMIYKEIMR